MQLGGGEAFDDAQVAAATRTEPAATSRFGIRVRDRARRVDASDQPTAQRQQVATLGVRQKAEVANAVEARGQHMQQEASQELVKIERQQPLLVAMS